MSPKQGQTMPSVVHHVSIVTSEPERVATFLREVLGMPPVFDFEVGRADVGELLNWPRASVPTPVSVRAQLFGSGNAGLVEVVEYPGVLEHPGSHGAPTLPTTGLAQLAFQVSDVAEVIERARTAGADQIVEPRVITVAGRPVLVAAVVLAGVRVQLTQTPPERHREDQDGEVTGR
jgi:catechol 2,3-dioxygenase-like lactoylglutathione lyase family enzyme